MTPHPSPRLTAPQRLPLMLDLFAGFQGSSSAFRARGWDVVTVDVRADFGCTVTADLSSWSWSGRRPDFIWASPPCDEFSRESMPWCRTGKAPSMALVEATRRIVRECDPAFWVMENVRGAQRWLGPARQHVGPFYLWGDFPPIVGHVEPFKEKIGPRPDRPALRAKVPESLSRAVADAIESGLAMLGGSR